jgi:tetratricopeptide (TPR) repeat protein
MNVTRLYPQLALAAALVLGIPASAAAPHVCHGMEMFNAAGLPPAPLRDGIGTSEFPMTARVPKARQYMRQGIALLHCFWFFEAYRSFLEVTRLDPASPLGYWGLYLVYGNFSGYDQQAKEQLGQALERINNAGEHEQYYLRASRLKTEKDDRKGYIREMESLIDRFPDDIDARLFLALELLSGYDTDGKPREGHAYSQSILEALLARHPDNVGANHYYVHAYEMSSHPTTALSAAERLVSLAPKSAHIVHMPGHIYFRTGDYARARQAFLASMKVDEAYLASEKVGAADDWNHAHNLAYLIATCAEDGRYADGQRFARKLEEVAAEPAHAANGGATMYTRAETGDFALARLQARYGDWAAAARNQLRFPIDEAHVHAQAKAYRDGLRRYLSGMAALAAGRVGDAARDADAVDAVLWRLQRSSDEDAPRNVRRILGLASYDLRANVVAARGALDEAVGLLRAAEKLESEVGYSEPPQFWRPVDESLGQIYLRAKRWEDARDAFQRALKVRPNNGFSLFGVGSAEAGAGNIAKAKSAFAAMLKVWADADPDLPSLKEARAWLAAH